MSSRIKVPPSAVRVPAQQVRAGDRFYSQPYAGSTAIAAVVREVVVYENLHT